MKQKKANKESVFIWVELDDLRRYFRYKLFLNFVRDDVTFIRRVEENSPFYATLFKFAAAFCASTLVYQPTHSQQVSCAINGNKFTKI